MTDTQNKKLVIVMTTKRCKDLIGYKWQMRDRKQLNTQNNIRMNAKIHTITVTVTQNNKRLTHNIQKRKKRICQKQQTIFVPLNLVGGLLLAEGMEGGGPFSW